MMKKNRKAQSGLTILLAVLATVFIIGILLMSFSMTSGVLKDSDMLYEASTLYTVNSESKNLSVSPQNLAYSGYRDVVCTVTTIRNTSDGKVIPTSNYTVTNCAIALNAGAPSFNGSLWNVTYNYTYSIESKSFIAINDTIEGLDSAPDFFPIYITVAAIVVIILLIVLIFGALRGSGMMGGGNAGGGTNVGGKEGA